MKKEDLGDKPKKVKKEVESLPKKDIDNLIADIKKRIKDGNGVNCRFAIARTAFSSADRQALRKHFSLFRYERFSTWFFKLK